MSDIAPVCGFGHERDLAALRARVAEADRMLTDEQDAHRLTAETLTKAIRDGDKAEQYRVERDKARVRVARLREALESVVIFPCKYDPFGPCDYCPPCNARRALEADHD